MQEIQVRYVVSFLGRFGSRSHRRTSNGLSIVHKMQLLVGQTFGVKRQMSPSISYFNAGLDSAVECLYGCMVKHPPHCTTGLRSN